MYQESFHSMIMRSSQTKSATTVQALPSVEEEKAKEKDQQPQVRRTSRRQSLTRSNTTSFAWYTGSSTHRLAEVDDEDGKEKFCLALLFESIESAKEEFVGTALCSFLWAILCSFGAQELRALAAADPGGVAEQWLDDIESCKNAVSVLGSLFVFTLVFRFNACYNRWWEGRIHWCDIVSKCMELAMMNRRFFDNEELQDRFSRFIIVFSYACKSLLRGKSLTAEGEDGPALVKRGLLTQQELDIMESSPSWQPHFCLDVIREVIVQLYKIQGLRLGGDDTAKIVLHTSLKSLNMIIGKCVGIRASGLPASYDAFTMTSFYAFFLLASVVWSAAIGWMTPVVISLATVVIMFLIVMGTKLVDPFGTDNVDIPMERFCATIEAQVQAIDQRSNLVIRVSSNTEVRPKFVRGDTVATFHIPKLA